MANERDRFQPLESLAGNSSRMAYFLVKATRSTTAPQMHTIKIWDSRPDLTGATVLGSCSYTFDRVRETIKASANRVTQITSPPSIPSLGNTFTVEVQGETGVVGNGHCLMEPSFGLRLQACRHGPPDPSAWKHQVWSSPGRRGVAVRVPASMSCESRDKTFNSAQMVGLAQNPLFTSPHTHSGSSELLLRTTPSPLLLRLPVARRLSTPTQQVKRSWTTRLLSLSLNQFR